MKQQPAGDRKSLEEATNKTRMEMPNQHETATALDRLAVALERDFDRHALLRHTMRTLANLDFEHHHEMQKVERSKPDPALRTQIVGRLRWRHHERREPYAKLIAELQKHLASGSLDYLKEA